MSFSDISLLLVVAGVFGIFARYLKQPLLIGFLFAGLALNYFGFISDHHLLDNMGKIGVTLLLFLVGMEMNIREMPGLGKTALVVGVLQISTTFILGFILSLALGISIISAIYIAIALTFSSTIIIIKLLSEKDDVNSLYGKISVGALLIQDLFVVLILMFLSGFNTGTLGLSSVAVLIVKAVVLFSLVWYLSKDILPKVFNKLVGSSQELLFTVSIAWALGLATLVGGPLGFSFEIGGFLAGLALSNLPEHLGISSKTKSLRDFFLTIFFVALGGQLLVSDVGPIVPKIVIFSLFVLVIKPIIVLIIMGITGHKSRTSFQTSVTMAQVSEFSFILMAMGKAAGHLQEVDLALVVIVGALTMTGSTYLISGSEKLYSKLKHLLKFFERKNTRESAFVHEVNLSNHAIIVGCDKIGNSVLAYFKKHNIDTVVIDFDPSVFAKLSADNVNVLLGDVTDIEILHNAKISDSRIVICTVPNIEENLSIINLIKTFKVKPVFIGSASSRADSIKLYEKGADYVLNPDLIAGEFLRHMFLNHGFNINRISKMGRSHFNRLMY